ncbi:HAD family hydrolase [Saccharospirillum salsuginis]|uniref:Hydrolase of the HAD superfamily n=1 Tax=Saccharospirillum salsuginis TaxID=418750 RepID=A0A918NHF5_9GAMM|nr:HAD-IA family hydrolase [Saccharospirillum salsuginis]GGX67930.1 hypothetical protein GCM10007392_39550 [Saccharospirillum salsuginis]
MDAIFLDFDGVIRHWRTEAVREAEAELGCPAGCLFQCAFDRQRLIPAITGRVTHECWQSKVRQALAADWGEDAASRLVSAWQAATWDLDHALLSDIRAKRPDRPIVLVTNATSSLGADLERCGLGGYFDSVVNSSEIGVAKPDAGFFEHALARVGVRADRSLFVDDSRTNVAAARDLNFQSIHFEDRATAWPAIVEILDRG